MGMLGRKTMTVAEMVAKLKEYPPDMEVLPTWEGLHTNFLPENFNVEDGKLVIDVDQY